MSKKFSITLAAILFLSFVPTNAAEKRSLPGFDSVGKDLTQMSNTESAKLQSETLKTGITSNTNDKDLKEVLSKNEQEYGKMEKDLENMDKQLDALDKVMDINNKINSINSDKSMSPDQKIKKLQGYNAELKDAMNTMFKGNENSTEYANVKKIFDTNDKMFDLINDKNIPDNQKFEKMMNLQKEYTGIMRSMNHGTAYGSSGGERNADLRRSSRNVYANSKEAPNWTIDQPFFKEIPEFINPSMASIKEKYRLGNFTGCMQEAEAYVRKNPKDTFGFYYLAMSYAKSGDKENAIKAYEKVISMHDSPIIVKYATNGRNCVMDGNPDKCYENVNLPDYVYPYAKEATSYNLTPIDADTLIQKNLAKVEAKMTSAEDSKNDENKKDDKSKSSVREVFSKQDDALDRFIKAPYGNGLSPELNAEYKKQQLKRLRESINKEQEGSGSYFNNFNNVRDFDKTKSEVDSSVKIAINDFEDKSFMNDPEYIQAQKEMKQIEMMFGSSSKKSNDLVDLLPSLIEQGNGNNIPPELMKTMVTNSMMTDIVDTSF